MIAARSRLIAVLLATLTLAALTIVLIKHKNAQIAAQYDVSAYASNPLLPLPVETYEPPTSLPLPTQAPTTPIPVAPPPAAISLPHTQGLDPNVAWSAQTDNSLTIRVGHYEDNPSPSMTGVRAVARWNEEGQPDYVATDLRTTSMAISPDHRYLALLAQVVCIPPPPEPPPTPSGPPPGFVPPIVDGPCEGDWPAYIYVIDLATNRVQSIPEYYKNYPAYEENTYFLSIMGWFDNDRLAIEDRNGQMIVATKDGTSFIKRIFPGQGENDRVDKSMLLPDHKTIFAWAGGAFYLRDADSGNIHKIGSQIEHVSYDSLTPSPDASLLTYLDPSFGQEGSDGRHYGLWVQELATGRLDMLIDKGVWDTRPSWSPDNSQIAFAHTDNIPTGDDAADTNIYIADIADHKARPLTNFTGAHNSDTQWTLGGNLVLSSTAGSATGLPGIVAVSTKDGTAKTLVSGAPGESLVRPFFFGEARLPGMPRVGSGDSTK